MARKTSTKKATKTKSSSSSSEKFAVSRAQISEALLDKIIRSIKASGVSGAAAMEGARLVEYWIEEVGNFDAQFPVIGAELPFFIILEKYTVVVGMQDKISLDAEGLFGSEWKTTKGTTRYWNEDKWLEQIKNGQQIATYGLGMHEGYFVVTPDAHVQANDLIVGEMGGPPLWRPQVKKPRILVRAITKENPPNLWGVDPPAFFEIDKRRLDRVREGMLLKADMIRAARNRKSVPWQLTGIQCQDRFHWGEMCRFYDGCSVGEYGQLPLVQIGEPLTLTPRAFNEDDPGSKAIKAAQSLMRVPITDERVVILSASAYSDATDCLEYYRRSVTEGSESDEELAKGTATHAGLAAYYNDLIGK